MQRMLDENDKLLNLMVADGIIPKEAIKDQKLVIMQNLDGIDLKKAHEVFMKKHQSILDFQKFESVFG